MEDQQNNDDIVYSESRGCTSSYSKSEMRTFASYINLQLEDVDYVKHILPLIPENPKMFEQLSDGLVYAAMVNNIKPETININKLAIKRDMNIFQKISNFRAVLAGFESLGIKLENMHAETLAKAPVMLNLGLTWIAIKNMVLRVVPDSGDKIEDSEKWLMNWFNELISKHPSNEGEQRNVTNWSSDLRDGTCYGLLLSSLVEDSIPDDFFSKKEDYSEEDKAERIELILQVCKDIGIEAGAELEDIVKGNSKINLMLTAEIYSNLEKIEKIRKEREEAKLLQEKLERERIEKERIEKERIEKERIERERVEREERERKEREEEEERQRQIELQKKKEEEERLKKEQMEREERERQQEMERQRQLKLEAERIANEEKIKVINDINELKGLKVSFLPDIDDKQGEEILYSYAIHRVGLEDFGKTDDVDYSNNALGIKITKQETEDVYALLSSGVVVSALINIIFKDIIPETVPFSKIEKNPKNIFQKISNSQQAIKGMQEGIDKMPGNDSKKGHILLVEDICSARNIVESDPKKSVLGIIWLLRQVDWMLNKYSFTSKNNSGNNEKGNTSINETETLTDIPMPKTIVLPENIDDLVGRVNEILDRNGIPESFLIDKTSFTLSPKSKELNHRRISTNIQSGRTMIALLEILSTKMTKMMMDPNSEGVFYIDDELLESVHTKDNIADYEINIERIKNFCRENNIETYPGSTAILEMDGPKVAKFLVDILDRVE